MKQRKLYDDKNDKNDEYNKLSKSILIIYNYLVNTLIIKQEIEWGDVIYGFDEANRYKLYECDSDGNFDSNTPLFKVIFNINRLMKRIIHLLDK